MFSVPVCLFLALFGMLAWTSAQPMLDKEEVDVEQRDLVWLKRRPAKSMRKFQTLNLTMRGISITLRLQRWDELYANDYVSIVVGEAAESNGNKPLPPQCVYRAQDVSDPNHFGVVSLCNDKFHATMLNRTDMANSYSIIPTQDYELGAHIALKHSESDARFTHAACDGIPLPPFSTDLRRQQQHMSAAIVRRDFPFGKLVKTVQLFIVNDAARFSQFGSSAAAVESDSAYIMGIVNTYYTLLRNASREAYGVRFVIQGQVSLSKRDGWLENAVESSVGARDLLQAFTEWKQVQLRGILPPRKRAKPRVEEEDMVLLFSGQTFAGSTVGVAYLGGVCTSHANTGVMQIAHWHHDIYGKIAAHEAGHLLGMRHDDTYDKDMADCGGMDSNRIMWSGISLAPGTTWSSCSAASFAKAVEQGQVACLENGRQRRSARRK